MEMKCNMEIQENKEGFFQSGTVYTYIVFESVSQIQKSIKMSESYLNFLNPLNVFNIIVTIVTLRSPKNPY